MSALAGIAAAAALFAVYGLLDLAGDRPRRRACGWCTGVCRESACRDWPGMNEERDRVTH
jgi:hypothetical protein